MKRTLLLIVGLFCAVQPLFATTNLEPLLNKVSLQFTAELWVTTQTALVNVSINAAVADQNIGNLQNEVLQKLKSLVDSNEWHIVSFERQQQQSGLESIQITAQARLPQTNLSNLRDKAKTLSKPGETLTIDSVDFVPSEDELRQANITLRNNIYQQIKTEIDSLNKIYLDQKFYIHNIDFLLNAPGPLQRNAVYMKAAGANALGSEEHAAAPLNVGNKVELGARVVIASMPAILTQTVTQKPQ